MKNPSLQLALVSWGWGVDMLVGFWFIIAYQVLVHAFTANGARAIVICAAGLVVVFKDQLIKRYGKPSQFLHLWSRRKAWNRAAVVCGLVGPFGWKPKLLKTIPTVFGENLVVQLPGGNHPGELEELVDALASMFQAREVRVVRDPSNASLAHISIVKRDPLKEGVFAWPFMERQRCSLWDPISLGMDETGRAASISLPERNVLIGGEPGAGKSVLLSILVATAALDPEVKLTLMDGKLVELAAWRGCADRCVGPEASEAIEVLGELRKEMNHRYERLLELKKRKVERGDGLSFHVVVVDELAFYLGTSDRKMKTEMTELLRDLVARGRAAGIIVLAATQKPSADVIPTQIRDLFSFKVAMRCATPQASDTVLGQGWAAEGYSAATIDPVARGVGFLLAEGGVPVRFRSCHLTDEHIDAIAARAQAIRGRT